MNEERQSLYSLLGDLPPRDRPVTAEELVLAVDKLGASLDYFTNPFLLAGEGKFSWRQSNVGLERLNAFERVAGRWVAASRTLAPQVGRPASYLRQALKLSSKNYLQQDLSNHVFDCNWL